MVSEKDSPFLTEARFRKLQKVLRLYEVDESISDIAP